MADFPHGKSSKYTDLATIYAECSGPGGLSLAEFRAEKMGGLCFATVAETQAAYALPVELRLCYHPQPLPQ